MTVSTKVCFASKQGKHYNKKTNSMTKNNFNYELVFKSIYNKKIAMTSPVRMSIDNSKSTMAFVIPSIYNKNNLPKPNDSSIDIITSEPDYAAAIQFGGFASDERINKYRSMLENNLKDKGLSFYDNFRYLGYNPPYQLLCRKNEVIVALHENNFN